VSGIVHWFSAGTLTHAIARAVGWSPVGREIKLFGVEGPEAGLLEGRSARVTEILGSDLIAELLPCHERRAASPGRLRLTPRHLGWTPLSLMLVGIAVVLVDESSLASPRPIGIAMAKLARSAPDD
jgi:hypothetical protein